MTTQKLAYTFAEAAEQSGYSPRTLKQAVADGNLAARYVKTEGVIRHEDLAAWIGQLPTKPDTGTNVGKATVQNDLKAGDNQVVTSSPVQGMDGKTSARPEPQPKAPPLSLPAPEREWLKPEDLAMMLQIALGTVNNWRSRKIGPEFVRVGGLVRYSPEAINAWLKAQPSQ